MRRITILFLLILFAFSVFATPDSSPIDWKLSGRLFLDGGVYIHSPKELHAGTHIADVRLAAKVRIYSNWYTKIDVGFERCIHRIWQRRKLFPCRLYARLLQYRPIDQHK